MVALEQRVPQLDRVNSKGKTEEAILDIIANIDGQSWMIDVSVVSPLSLDRQLVRGAARTDGFMAARREDDKRRRYDHQCLVPFVFETTGRPGQKAVDWMKLVYANRPTEMQAAWRRMSVLIQAHVVMQAQSA